MTWRQTILALVALGIPVAASASARTVAGGPASGGAVQVELYENLRPGSEWTPRGEPTERYGEPAFGLVRTPLKFSPNAIPLDRSTPFVLRAVLRQALAPGEYQFRLRSRGAARFLVDGRELLATQPQKPNVSGNDPVPPPPPASLGPIRPAPGLHQDVTGTLELDSGAHEFVLLAIIGGKGLVPTPGELSVSVGRVGELPRLLGPGETPRLTDAGWEQYAADAAFRHREADRARRREVSAGAVAAWDARHREVRALLARRPSIPVPAVPAGTPVYNAVDRFIGARWNHAGQKPAPLTSDLEFLRRLALDTTGIIPTAAEIRQYLRTPPATRRQQAIERFLARPGWADHWVSYWQDVLAENPGILKPDLNNTGPFRWWLHQSFEDNLPFDRLAAELVLMEGSSLQGGPAGFAQATLNDAPMAAKAHVVAQAFLAENLACARCHDAPQHPFRQQDLFGIAAMLSGKAVTIPETSTVPFREGARRPAVKVTSKPGEPILPAWCFARFAEHTAVALPAAASFADKTPATRRQLAALLIAPENPRFAQVVVNRIWKRTFGRGLVEPADDWNLGRASHPELLQYLAREFVVGGYDLKRLARLLFSSHLYQRQSVAVQPGEDTPRFAGPARRRLSAEQVLDSVFAAVGKEFGSEELNLNPIGDRPLEQFLNLGAPRRAWEFTALSNERDRPALALPISQGLVDMLTTFGWRQSRQNPTAVRDDAASPMQTLLLANGNVGARLVRLSDDSAFTELCLQARSLPALVRELFLRVLSRPPTPREQARIVAYLQPTFSARQVPGATREVVHRRTDTRVSWSNHLSEEATRIRLAEERQQRLGDTPTRRLKPAFRERFEDALWAVLNSPEFVVVP